MLPGLPSCDVSHPIARLHAAGLSNVHPPQVTPSSKCVGDLAIYLVTRGLTTQDVLDPAKVRCHIHHSDASLPHSNSTVDHHP